jgi:hypothetical protein
MKKQKGVINWDKLDNPEKGKKCKAKKCKSKKSSSKRSLLNDPGYKSILS